MLRFNFVQTSLAGLVLVQRKAIEDDRGFLSRFYCADEFRSAGLDKPIAQINHTLTRKKGRRSRLAFSKSTACRNKTGELLERRNMGCCD
jgi:dTDP-4-dehydrorhamnose 3,5-epimerase